MNNALRRQLAIATSIQVVATRKEQKQPHAAPRASGEQASTAARSTAGRRAIKRAPVRHAGINE
jgi:hypothetical protein